MSPLRKGFSKETISKNIAEMIRAGHSRLQAVAAAFTTADKARAKVGKKPIRKRK